MATTYSPTTKCSTIGAGGLNFSVRNGKRWNPAAIVTLSFHGGLRFTTPKYFKHIGNKQKSSINLQILAKVFGQLVLLGFDVTAFTPVAYQRRGLRRPSKEISS